MQTNGASGILTALVCIHCGRTHGTTPYAIATECRAVKEVRYQGDVHVNGFTTSFAGITSIEYVSLEDQDRLIQAVIMEMKNSDTRE